MALLPNILRPVGRPPAVTRVPGERLRRVHTASRIRLLLLSFFRPSVFQPSVFQRSVFSLSVFSLSVLLLSGSLLAAPRSMAANLGKLPAPEDRPRPTTTALALAAEEAPEVDGILDDEVWTRAQVVGDFVQREPAEGEAASERTEFQVAFTPSTLYIAARLYDRDPELIVAKELGRDGSVRDDDRLFIVLDTFLDRRNGYYFETNANGAETDALITDEGRDFNFQWDGVWRAEGRKAEDGWVSEIAIPFSTLRYDPQQTSWGLQIGRTLRRRNETSYWAPLPRENTALRISRAGTLEGLSGLDPSRQVDIKPFIVGSSAQSVTDGNTDDLDAGLDVKWGVTQSMRLDLTVNTDFAETEVDEQQINLTRFSLFFPEKREFFLENSGIFEFGTQGSLFKGFFSRRIGIDSNNEEAPLQWGARLTGRAGSWNLGFVTVQVGETDTDPDTGFQVMRAKRNLGTRSSIGALVTRRDEGSSSENLLIGLDLALKPTDKTSLNAYFASTKDEQGAIETNDQSFGVSGDYRSGEWNVNFNAVEIGDDFNPRVGFLRRTDVRSYGTEVNYEPLVDWTHVRSLRFGFEGDYVTNLEGVMESSRVEFKFFGLETQPGDRIFLSITDQSERLFEDFEIRDELVLAAGRYDFDPRLGLSVESSNKRTLSLWFRAGTGGFYDGDRTNFGLGAVLRPNKHLRTETSVDLNSVELPGGSFDSNLYRQRVTVNLNSEMFLNGLIQYDESGQALGLNLRFNWIYRPGADLFVVFNQTWNADGFNNLDREDRQVVVKFTYLFQL